MQNVDPTRLEGGQHLIRALATKQKPSVVWLTGLSGAGKTTISLALEARLQARGLHTMMIDGDALRAELCRDLGFDELDRAENIRRATEVSALMLQAGLIVIAALISPFQRDRDRARRRFAPGAFCEVFVDTPLSECVLRDPKGLYSRSKAGSLHSLSGVDSPYEVPATPEIRVQTVGRSAQSCAEQIEEYLITNGYL